MSILYLIVYDSLRPVGQIEGTFCLQPLFTVPQKTQALSIQRRSWTSCFNHFFSLLPFCRFLLFVSSPFQLVFPFAKGGRDGSAASYIVSKHGRGIVTPPPLSLTPTIPVPCPFCCPPTTIHPELEWARGGQLLGLQLICAPPWKAFIGSMPHATHDGHTHTRTLLWFCRARLSCSSQAGGWSPSQLQPLPA